MALFGDVTKDGVVNSEDATEILVKYAEALVKGKSSAQLDEKIADVNKDGKINSEDATIILVYYANVLINEQKTGTLEDFMKKEQN